MVFGAEGGRAQQPFPRLIGQAVAPHGCGSTPLPHEKHRSRSPDPHPPRAQPPPPRDKELAKFEAFLNKEQCMHINALVRNRSRLAYPMKG